MATPDSSRRVERLLVPLDGSEAAYQALGAACDIARLHRASVSSLYVIEVPRTLPLDADLDRDFDRGEAILSRAEEVARGHKGGRGGPRRPRRNA